MHAIGPAAFGSPRLLCRLRHTALSCRIPSAARVNARMYTLFAYSQDPSVTVALATMAPIGPAAGDLQIRTEPPHDQGMGLVQCLRLPLN
jgi:hypothetical protein